MSIKNENILYEHGHPVERVMGLSVDEVVALAKAGVQVELAGRVTIDNVPPPIAHTRDIGSPHNDISEGIRQRYFQSQRAKMTPNDVGSFIDVPAMCAFEHGEKVYVFIYNGRSEPEMIDDEASIYPSDALLARIHLMMKHAK